jgi:transposase
MCEQECKIVEELRERIEVLEKKLAEAVEKLEKYERPEKHSGNSSLPPSSDQNKKHYPKREKSGRKQGGQLGHIGKTRMLTDNPDKIVAVFPEKCIYCGGNHFIEKDPVLERRQVADIPEIKPFVIEYQQKAGFCTKCGKRNLGKFPENVSPNVQIGEKAKAFAGYLNVHAHVSYDKIAQLFTDMLRFNISKGTINNKIKELALDLNPEYENILENLRKSDVIGSDETTTRINGKKAYLWTFQNDENVFFLTGRRNFQIIEDTIGNSFAGSWISDRFGAQLKIKAPHQLCLAHLIRESKYIIETCDSQWAKDLKNLFKGSIEFKREKGNDFEPLETETFRRTQEFKTELADLFTKPPPEKEALKLYKGLIGRLHQILHFLEKKNVSPTNNASERALRNSVIHKKVTGGFRSDFGAQAHNIIASFIETAKKLEINIFTALSNHSLSKNLLTA